MLRARSVTVLIALGLTVCAAFARPAREAEGDVEFALGNFKLARALYREALRTGPKVDRIWAKYDLAYLREMALDAAPHQTIVVAGPVREARPQARTTMHKVRVTPAPPLGAPVEAVGPMTMARPSSERALEPAVDREPGRPSATVPSAELPKIPGEPVDDRTTRERADAEQAAQILATQAPSTTQSGQALEDAQAQGLLPQTLSVRPPENARTTLSGPPDGPDGMPAGVTLLGPNEVIPAGAVQPGDAPAASVGSRGEPLVVRGAGWDVWSLRYAIDLAGRPHVLGKLRNIGSTDFVNPAVNVALIDSSGVQVAFKPVKLVDPAGVLFPGASGEFDAEFPAFTSPIAAYRLYVVRP